MENNNQSGVELIAQERDEQINKHGFDISEDKYYSEGELVKAALFSIKLDKKYYPKNWEEWFANKMRKKKERLSKIEFAIERYKIAGAFLAAEIDRLKNIEP